MVRTQPNPMPLVPYCTLSGDQKASRLVKLSSRYCSGQNIQLVGLINYSGGLVVGQRNYYWWGDGDEALTSFTTTLAKQVRKYLLLLASEKINQDFHFNSMTDNYQKGPKKLVSCINRYSFQSICGSGRWRDELLFGLTFGRLSDIEKTHYWQISSRLVGLLALQSLTFQVSHLTHIRCFIVRVDVVLCLLISLFLRLRM